MRILLSIFLYTFLLACGPLDSTDFDSTSSRDLAATDSDDLDDRLDDESDLSGGSDSTGGSESSVKRVFLTSQSIDHKFGTTTGGIDKGDDYCNELAAQADIGGTFKAWLSDDYEDARDRIEDVGPWYLVDEVTLVAESLSHLIDGSGLNHKIDMNEEGAVLDSDGFLDGIGFVFTGTNADGTASSFHCNNWQAIEYDLPSFGFGIWDSSTNGGFSTGEDWTSMGTITCGGPRPIFCFEQ